VARILIVGGGCRGRRLASELVRRGDVVRITTRGGASRAAIEESGAECWIGTPERLATLSRALENVTVLCWLLGCAGAGPAHLRASHTFRLESFLTQAIDTTVRGFVYETAGGGVSPDVRRQGERIVGAIAERNAVPVALLRPLADSDAWLVHAKSAVDSVLLGNSAFSPP
jgi:uncharacterized protein YbjT (DUF2867 family)